MIFLSPKDRKLSNKKCETKKVVIKVEKVLVELMHSINLEFSLTFVVEATFTPKILIARN